MRTATDRLTCQTGCACGQCPKGLPDVFPRNEEDSPDEEACEHQRRVGLAEANDNQGYAHKKCDYIEPPAQRHSVLLDKGEGG